MKHLPTFIVGLIAVVALYLGIGAHEQPKPTQSTNVGAVAGPDIPFEYLRWGIGYGSAVFPAAVPLTTSTTTPCTIQSPAATTTLERFAIRLDVSTTTATAVVFTKGTAMNATTTALSGLLALAANAQGAFVASTTPNSDESRIVLAPSTWVQVSMIGGNGTVSPSGQCTAVFRVI